MLKYDCQKDSEFSIDFVGTIAKASRVIFSLTVNKFEFVIISF